MNIAEKRATLKAHPKSVTLSLAGKEYTWALSRWGLRLARAAGLDVDRVLALFSGSGGTEGEMLEMSGDLVAVGLLPFFDDPEDVLDLLDVTPLPDLADLIPQITDALVDAGEAADAGEPGKADAGRS